MYHGRNNLKIRRLKKLQLQNDLVATALGSRFVTCYSLPVHVESE
jgi:hypothetical protein